MLAQITGLSPALIAKIMTGSPVTANSALVLGVALDLDPEEILVQYVCYRLESINFDFEKARTVRDELLEQIRAETKLPLFPHASMMTQY